MNTTYTTGGNGTKSRIFHIDSHGVMWVPTRSGKQWFTNVSPEAKARNFNALSNGGAKRSDARGTAYASR